MKAQKRFSLDAVWKSDPALAVVLWSLCETLYQRHDGLELAKGIQLTVAKPRRLLPEKTELEGNLQKICQQIQNRVDGLQFSREILEVLDEVRDGYNWVPRLVGQDDGRAA